MLKNVSWSDDRAYRTGTQNEPLEFYLNGLCNSKNFDLLLGYFSSAAINILSIGFATFLHNGGKMRMVVNNILSQEDKDAIQRADNGNINERIVDLSDIKSLKTSLGEYGNHFFECLAWLIANDRIQLKIIRPKNGQGISHYKNGIFYDETDYVGFSASCNFTAFGLLENLERLDAFLSWENNRSTKFVNGIRNEFEEIFLEKAVHVEYMKISEIEVAIKKEFGEKSLDELLIQEKELIKKRSLVMANKALKKAFQIASANLERIESSPKFPYSEGPREYQIDAYKKWCENGFNGIFAMATGTGKTITSLNCVLEQFKENKTYKAIVLVPTIALLQQWEGECRKFNFKNVIKINSTTNWQNEISFLNTAKHFIETSYIIIATYASFHKPRFQEFFKGLDKNTILIGDEVHNMGSPKILELLPKIKLKKRIGLSATPKRIYDEIGGTKLEMFFNDKEPYIYNYSMSDAIKKGVLCPYLYFPHIIRLTDIEFKEYIEISKQLVKYFDSKEGKYKSDKIVEILLLKRKRIIQKAENKKVVFEQILMKEFTTRGNLKYALVYVPEGIEADYTESEEQGTDDEDTRLIDQYTKLVSKIDKKITVKQFTSETEGRDSIINDFRNGKVQVLTSMKCLDEGIDVPRSELAIFCSSTGNPRQFIQRRGRILRLHKDKAYATIHDLVVIPKKQINTATYQMERSLIQKELERVVNFSNLADNKIETYMTFQNILEEYNINLNDL